MSHYAADLAELLARDQGLPGRCFLDEDFLELERHHVFESAWTCVALSADIPSHGSLFPLTLLGQPLLLSRDTEAVQAFHNVCSHRGAVLVDTPLRGRPRIVCPYHGWTYRLDGTLAATPHVGGPDRHACESLDPCRLSLRKVSCAEWAGHIFVNLSGAAPPFADWISSTAKRLGDLDWSELRRDASLAAAPEVRANWKIVVENFVESYHLPWVHHELNSVNPMSRHYQILGGHAYLGQGGTAYEAERIVGSGLPLRKGGDARRYEALFVFPNLILAPLADMAFSILLLPETAAITRERLEFWFVGDEALGEAHRIARETSAAFIARVNAEDIGIVERVQRGRRSQAFSGGQFSHPQEASSLQFQKMVASWLLAAGERAPQSIVELPTADVAYPPATSSALGSQVPAS